MKSHHLLRNIGLPVLLSIIVLSFIINAHYSQHQVYAASGPTVGTWLTTTDGHNLLAQQSDQIFQSGTNPSGTIVDVNDQQKFQQMQGFGGAMTDSSAYIIGQVLNSTERNTLMQNLFGSSGNNSINMSFARIPMGSSDFSATPASNPQPYSYDDLPAGQTDPTLSHFSISHDLTYIIPVLKQALQINPQLTYMANPWSPPAWMKTNGSMIGHTNGVDGTLISSDYEPLAQYFVKFLQAYQAQGIPIFAVTPQNEPLYIPSGYPGMSLSQDQEVAFINNNLGPDLAKAGLSSTKILGYDFNRQNTAYPEAVLGQTGSYVSGISWHCYAQNPGEMTTIHNLYPSKDQYETECSPGIISQSIIDETLDDVQNWGKSVLAWNIALYPNNGPLINGGCGTCSAIVQVNPSSHAITYTTSYYQLGQVSKFVVPGAYHISSTTGNSSLKTAAFTNPDGSHVLVIHNTSSSSQTFNVRWDSTQSFPYTLPAGGIVTFKWSSSSTPTPTPTTPGSTPTATPTQIPTSTPTPTPTQIPTSTPTPTPTGTPTGTPTATPTPVSNSSCKVSYTVTNQWSDGFGANIAITNTGSTPWNGWALKFSFPAGQQVLQLWNGTASQSGSNVTVTNASYNGTVAAGAAVNSGPGFNGSWTSSNPNPTSFTVNGATCSVG